MNILLRTFASFCIFLFAFHLTSCSSGGGGGNSNASSSSAPTQNPDPQKPSDNLFIGGQVKGLKQGQRFWISNGIDGWSRYQVVTNGEQVYWNDIPKASPINIKIAVHPETQFCEISETRNIIVNNLQEVNIVCADLVERKVEVEKPVSLTFNQLSMRSNYEYIKKGSLREVSDDSEGNTIKVFNNSFVVLNAVLDGKEEPIYLAHINDLSDYVKKSSDERKTDPIVIGPTSTAFALILMEPTISAALLDRANPVATAGGFASLYDVIQALEPLLLESDEFKDLSLVIKNRATQKKHLLLPNDDFFEPLQKAMLKTADILTTQSDLKLLLPVNGLLQSGLSISVDKQDGEDRALISVLNNAGRWVSLIEKNGKYETEVLESFGYTEVEVEPDLSQGDSLDFVLVGPGELSGTTVYETEFWSTLVASVLDEHFFESLNLYLGLESPASFDAAQCADPDVISSVAGVIEGYLKGLQLDLNALDYNYLMAEINSKARGELIKGFASDNSLLHDIFDCDRFGPSAFFDDQRNLAEENVNNLSKVNNLLFDSGEYAMDLTQFPGLTHLLFAIKNTQAKVEWSYAKNLQVAASHPVKAAVNTEVRFQGSCTKPTADSEEYTPCYMVWDFSDGTVLEEVLFESGRSSATHSFSEVGTYDVVLSGRTEDGQSLTSTSTISIVKLEPEFTIERDNCSQDTQCLKISPDSVHELSDTQINKSTFFDYRIRNTGTAPLNVSSITSDDENIFEPVQQSFINIEPGASEVGRIRFKPNSTGTYLGSVTFTNNSVDEEQRFFTVSLKGNGVTPEYKTSPANGTWQVSGDVVESGGVKTVTYSRSNELKEANIRLFETSGDEFGHPQIFFSNLAISRDLALGDSVTIDLADNVVGGTINQCRGFIALEKSDPDKFYCTVSPGIGRTSEELSGNIKVTAIANNQWKLEYDFEAAQVSLSNCPYKGDLSKCNTIRVVGEAVIPAID